MRTIKEDEDEEKTDNSRRKLHGREACEGSRPAPGEEGDDGDGAAEDGIGSWRGRRAIFIGGRMHVYLSVLLLLTSIQLLTSDDQLGGEGAGACLSPT